MPKGATKFKRSWLEKEDNNGHVIGCWLAEDPKCEMQAKCVLCSSTIKCSGGGIQQILIHAHGKNHKERVNAKFNKNQLKFAPVAIQGANPLLWTHGDRVRIAEAAWALHCAKHNHSYRSSDHIPELFNFMFNSPLAADFTMSRSKMSYLISDGLGPYFKDELSKMIREYANPFVIHFDETGTVQNKKQCDVLVRVWSNRSDKISQVCNVWTCQSC
ncbi:Uncharacterised protein r2_g4007 [Pycnogonum litorale]